MPLDFHDLELAAEFEALRRDIAADFAANPEHWTPGTVAYSRSSASLRRLLRLLEQRRHAEALAEMAKFVRLSRAERGINVIPFPSRPRRTDSTPADSPPAG